MKAKITLWKWSVGDCPTAEMTVNEVVSDNIIKNIRKY